MDENIKALWEAFNGKVDNLGTLEEFRQRMSDVDNARSFHKAVSPMASNLGTFEEFWGRIEKKNLGGSVSGTSSSTLPSAPTAARNFRSASIKPGDSIGKGQPSKAMRYKEAIVSPPEEKEATAIDYVKAIPEVINKGFYQDFVGGTLKGAGELHALLTRPVAKMMDMEFTSEDSWIWQAGEAVSKQFDEGGVFDGTAPQEVLESDFGQIGRGVGQMAGMIMSAPKSMVQGAVQSGSILKEGARQFFSRPAVSGSLQMVSGEAEKIRQEKEVVENMARDEYVSMMGEGSGETYDKLKANDAEDILAEMLPVTLAAGSTEAIPVAGFFKRMNTLTGGGFTKAVLMKTKDITVGTIEGATQEAVQEYMVNLGAKDVYNYTQDVTEGLEQSAKVGGGTQLIFEIIGAAIGAKKKGASGQDVKVLEEAEALIAEKESVLAENLETEINEVANAREELVVEENNAVKELAKVAETGEGDMDVLIAAASDPGGTMEVVKSKAGELGITEEGVAAIETKVAETVAAQGKVPEELRDNPVLVGGVMQKAELDGEAEVLENEKAGMDEAFHGPINERLAEIKDEKKAVEERMAAVVEGKEPKEKAPVKNPTFVSGNWEVNESTMEVHMAGKPKELAKGATKAKVLREYRNARIDRFALQGDFEDMTHVTPGREGEAAIRSNAPAQVAQHWLAEEDYQGVDEKTAVIYDGLKNNTFSEEALGGIPDVRGYNPNKGEKATVVDLKEFAEELSESSGMNITEADLADAIRDNPTGKFEERSGNPVKNELAKRFKELTGININADYANRLIKRSDKLREERGITAAYDPPKQEDGGGGKLRGFFANSLKKAAGSTDGKKFNNRIAEANPQYYNTMNIKGYAQEVEAEIDAVGIDRFISDALADPEPNEDMRRKTAKRVISLIAIGDMIAEAYRAGNMAVVDELSAKAFTLEERIARRGTDTGQENAFLAYYSMTPEGQLARAIRKVNKRRNEMREAATESGRSVGQVVDDIVSAVANEANVGKEVVIDAIRASIGIKNAVNKAKSNRSRAAKEVRDVFREIGRDILKKAGSAPTVKPSLLIKAFNAVKKLVGTSVQEAKIRFAVELKKVGGDDVSALLYLEQNHPDLFVEEMELTQISKEVSDSLDAIAEKNRGVTGTEQSLLSPEERAKMLEPELQRLKKAAEKKLLDEKIKLASNAVVSSARIMAKEGTAKKMKEYEDTNSSYKILNKIIASITSNKTNDKKISDLQQLLKDLKKEISDHVDVDAVEKHITGADTNLPSKDMAMDIAAKIGLNKTQEAALESGIRRAAKVRAEKVVKTRLSQIVAKHEPSKKKIRLIENALLEAIVLGGLNDDLIRRKIEEKYGIKSFSNQEIAELNALVGEIKDLPSNRAKRAKMIEVMDYIADARPADSVELIQVTWYALVLSSFQTVTAAILFSNIVNSAIDMAYYSAFTKGGRHAFAKSMARLLNPNGTGLWFGLSEAWSFIATGTGYRSMNKITSSSLLERMARRPGRSFGKYAATGLRYTMRFIAAADAISFYTIQRFHLDRLAYQSALAEGLTGKEAHARADEIMASTKAASEKRLDEARKRLMEHAALAGVAFSEAYTDKDVTYLALEMTETGLDAAYKGASETATKRAEEITLQNKPTGIFGLIADAMTFRSTKPEDVFADFGMFKDDKGLNWFKNRVKKVGETAFTAGVVLTFPFMKPMANTVNRALDFFFLVGIPVKRWLEPALEKKGWITSQDFSNADERAVFVAKSFTGMLLFSMWLFIGGDDEDDKEFMITAGGPKDWHKKSEAYNKGWKPYTVRVGGKEWYYRDSVFGMLLSVIGQINDNKRWPKEEEAYDLGDGLLMGMMGYFTSASFLQQFNDLTESLMRQDANKFGLFLVRPLTGFTNPGLARDIDRWTSPELREKKSFENKFLGAIIANTAVLNNYLLDYKFNSMGQTIDPYKHDAFFNQFTGMSKYISDAGPYNEVYEVLAEKGVDFKKLGDRTQLMGRDMETREYLYYALVVGRYRNAVLSKMVPELRAMDKEALEFQLDEVDADAKRIAKALTWENQLTLFLDPDDVDRQLGDPETLIARYYEVVEETQSEDSEIEKERQAEIKEGLPYQKIEK